MKYSIQFGCLNTSIISAVKSGNDVRDRLQLSNNLAIKSNSKTEIKMLQTNEAIIPEHFFTHRSSAYTLLIQLDSSDVFIYLPDIVNTIHSIHKDIRKYYYPVVKNKENNKKEKEIVYLSKWLKLWTDYCIKNYNTLAYAKIKCLEN